MHLRSPLAVLRTSAFACAALLPALLAAQPAPQKVLGYTDFGPEARIEEKFLAVPDARRAGEELKELTAAPHMAATTEDPRTAK